MPVARAHHMSARKQRPRLKQRSATRTAPQSHERAVAWITEVERRKHNRVVKKRCWRDNSRPFLLTARAGNVRVATLPTCPFKNLP
jgi:hypothetical protein